MAEEVEDAKGRVRHGVGEGRMVIPRVTGAPRGCRDRDATVAGSSTKVAPWFVIRKFRFCVIPRLRCSVRNVIRR